MNKSSESTKILTPDEWRKQRKLWVAVEEALKSGMSIEEATDYTGASLSYVTQLDWKLRNPDDWMAYTQAQLVNKKKKRIRARANELRRKRREAQRAAAESVSVVTPVVQKEIPESSVQAFHAAAMAVNALAVEVLHSTAKKEEDVVNSPTHYTHGGIETIDFIRAKLTREEYVGYLRGNILKYSSRLGLKDSMERDAGKLAWYSHELAKFLENK